MSDEPYITCEEVLTFLWAYLAAELPPEKVHQFERHLAVCPTCVSYIETYKETVALTAGALEAEAEESQLPEELVAAVLAARRSGG